MLQKKKGTESELRAALKPDQNLLGRKASGNIKLKIVHQFHTVSPLTQKSRVTQTSNSTMVPFWVLEVVLRTAGEASRPELSQCQRCVQMLGQSTTLTAACVTWCLMCCALDLISTSAVWVSGKKTKREF